MDNNTEDLDDILCDHCAKVVDYFDETCPHCGKRTDYKARQLSDNEFDDDGPEDD